MKRYLYSLCFLVALVGLDACKKESDPAPDPVVGSWKLGRIRFSEYPSPFTSLNVDRPTDSFGIAGSFNIKSDKSFTETYNNGVVVRDYKGNWEFTNNTLQLKYDTGDNESYTLDATQDPVQLISSSIPDIDSLRATATSPVQAVPFKYQFIYTK